MGTEPHLDFAGKTAAVTGAAQGIGEATAIRLAAGGAKVLIVDINVERARQVEADIKGKGGKAIAMAADVTKPDEIKAFIDHMMGAWGRIDVLVNNASNVARVGADDGDVVSSTMEVWDLVYACNLRAAAAASKFAIPHMITNGGGAIVNISSVDGMNGDIVRAAYGAAKAGLISLTKHIATAFGPQRIRCNTVSPGLVMSQSAKQFAPKPFLDMLADHTPFPGTSEPSDMAEVIAFLASDKAISISGENIVADRGLTCHVPFYADMRRGVSVFK